MAIPLDQKEHESSFSKLQKFLNQALQEKSILRLLEAGCGSASQLLLPGKQVHTTGIDISKKQLARNQSLDVRILADIQYYEYKPSSFDIIACFWVLEHLARPDLALDGFATAIDEGGLIILAIPNLMSIKGLITKYTPHFIHIWVYRYLQGRENSGRDDIGPFRTYFRRSMSSTAIKRFAEANDLQVIFFETSDILGESWYFAGGKVASFVRALYKVIKNLVQKVTFGLLGDSDCYMVLKKLEK